jgi:signal transduction histidine kinase
MTNQFSHNEGRSSRAMPTTILVVDDEKHIRELCELALRNYRVIQASTCEEALQAYKTEHVDLILSDIMMPGESGIDLLKQVKALNPNAAVVMMTGFVDKEIILNALKEDADDFINKPLNLLQLKTSIDKTLDRKALKEELASIKRSDELKNAFLSLVSHKLRTPITGISLVLQNLQMEAINSGDAVIQQNIAMACEEVQYLGVLVADLLVFSQVMVSSAGVLKKPVDLNEIIAEALLKCREMHREVDIAVDYSTCALPPIPLDASKIRFALLQVIDNAIKFSGTPCYVTISTEKSGEFVQIVISDSGTGIPESEIPRVFEKFYQIDPNNTGQIRGFGLGLFYAREFIQQHGGSIGIASRPDSGTAVAIHLPLQ